MVFGCFLSGLVGLWVVWVVLMVWGVVLSFTANDGKPNLSLYPLNLLQLQMDIALFAFDVFKEKKEHIK